MRVPNMNKLYYGFFAIIIIAFLYYLMFWQNSNKRTPNYKKKQTYVILSEYENGPLTSSKKNELYLKIKTLFSDKGVCDEIKMFKVLQKYYNIETSTATDNSRKRANLINIVLDKLNKENRFILVSKESSRIFMDIDKHIQNNKNQILSASINQLYQKMIGLEIQNNKSFKQFLIGIVIGILGLVPFIIEIIKLSINSLK